MYAYNQIGEVSFCDVRKAVSHKVPPAHKVFECVILGRKLYEVAVSDGVVVNCSDGA